MNEALRLMAVHAHPDDEASKGAATLARYAAEGCHVSVVTCTGGERGEVLNPRLAGQADIEENLPSVRREEMARCVAALGIKHHWLGYVDSGYVEGGKLEDLPEGCFARTPLDEATASLVKLIREEKPQVLVTYDEIGGYPHPDHIMCHLVSVAAYRDAADPAYRPDLGPAWEISKLYYVHAFQPQRIQAFLDYLERTGQETPYREFMESAAKRPQRLLTTRVDVADYLHKREEALLAHATQVDPDGIFFAIPTPVLREIWPSDDYELRASRIGVELPETDLFAGIRETVNAVPRSETAQKETA
ncbi:mycothiol conjugate amidase Mca [Dermabacteraceae bacterium P13103]